MFCIQCGTESPEDSAQFCIKCGRPFPSTDSTEDQAEETREINDSATTAINTDAEVSTQNLPAQEAPPSMGNVILPGGYQLASGERVISNESFKFSLSHWWLKTDIALTNRSILWERPNLILGGIPAGRQTGNIPLGQVGSVNTNREFSIKRLLIGLFVLIIGTAISQPLLTIICVIAAVIILASLFQTTMAIEHRGGPTMLKATVTQKTEIEALSNRISQTMAADR